MGIRDIVRSFRLIRRCDLMQRELIQSLYYLKNMVILGKGRSMSSELLMEELAEICEILKPAFQDMAHYLHIYDKESAAEVLNGYLNTGFSRDLGIVLAGWEDIPPDELLGTVEIYLDSLREDSRGKREKRDEIISELIYFPVVLNAMLVLTDFVFVAYFIEQQAMFNQLF